MTYCKHTFQYEGQEITMETGRIARQAGGSVLVTAGDTIVLGTVVGGEVREGFNFMPLTVHYQEKYYAGGRIPGGFFRREGRPTEQETLVSRLIDRPLRPLFPKSFRHEVQVICMVMSADPDTNPDMLAMLAASAALSVSGIPFNGPVAGARVGYTPSQGYVLNPGRAALKESHLNMIVAGTSDALLMVESEAKELPEDKMLGAVLFAQQHIPVAIDAIHALTEKAGKPAWDWQPPAVDESLRERCMAEYADAVAEAFQIAEKSERGARLASLRASAVNAMSTVPASNVGEAMSWVQREVMRRRVLDGHARMDGRDTKTVRPISVEAGLLPRVHGSALFTRGETQAIGAVTLGGMRSAQIIDVMSGESKDAFLLHYNFPPYSVGEAGRVMPPGRREIGHGRLARRALEAVLPTDEEFPYTIRVVSEITESNGSSSMATVCASSLALMDAGVPIKAPVAGVAMGLVKEEGSGRYAVLTDILGDEDHLGDMDFKVAGTADGVNALQMDIKAIGVTEEILDTALRQAREARMHILSEMNQVLSASREDVSPYAPRIRSMRIDVDKIRDVIGKGGVTIRAICEASGADINIEDDGVIKIYAPSVESLENAEAQILAITEDPEIGTVYTGKVIKIMDFGAFVNFLPGKDGLVHISQIAPKRIEKVTDHLHEGQEVRVKVLDIDERGRVRLSIKAVTLEDVG